MTVDEYYEELDDIMKKLKKAHNTKNSKKITHYTQLLNVLWEKGQEIRIEAMKNNNKT